MRTLGNDILVLSKSPPNQSFIRIALFRFRRLLPLIKQPAEITLSYYSPTLIITRVQMLSVLWNGFLDGSTQSVYLLYLWLKSICI